jgi:hypothetical protein
VLLKHGAKCSCLVGRSANGILGLGGGAATCCIAGLAGGGGSAGGAGCTGRTGFGLVSSACGTACVLFSGTLVARFVAVLVEACACCCCCCCCARMLGSGLLCLVVLCFVVFGGCS